MSQAAERLSSAHLADVLKTYHSLRIGMVVIAGLVPVVVPVWAGLFGVPWQDSLSAYYFAPRDFSLADPTGPLFVYPGRVLFVGSLFALGSFLYLYRGFSRRENIALNMAGISAIMVAIFPMKPETHYIRYSNIIHFGSAILLFLCMAYTAIFCHRETLRWIKDAELRRRFTTAYWVIGVFMAIFPATGCLVAWLVDAVQRDVYWIEAAGIEAFAAFWITKSYELSLTLGRRALPAS